MNEKDLEAEPSRSNPLDTSPPDVTALLQAWTAGDQGARDRLIPLVYRELHALAHHYMAGEQPDATLQTTGLVNELYVRLVDVRRIGWTGRTHFFAVCAKLMRRVLVDVARSRKAAKRGGHAVHVPMDVIPTVPHRIQAELGAPLHVARMRVTTPEVRLVDPLASGIPEDRFGVGADEEELKRLGIGFPDNGAKRLDEARKV